MNVAIVTGVMLVGSGSAVAAQRVRASVGMQAEGPAKSSHSNLWKVPAYCGSQIDKWTITPLPKAYAHKMTPLQIMAVTRHGARAPLGGASVFCWDGYQKNEWDCNMTTVENTDAVRSDATTVNVHSLRRAFRKVYEFHGGELHGDCEAGQLLREGYDQARKLGAHLKKAYVGVDNKIWTQTNVRKMTNKNFFLLRSDDLPPTIMTSQVLFDAFFADTPHTPTDPAPLLTIPVMTTEHAYDWLWQNEKLCPRLKQARVIAHKVKYTQIILSSFILSIYFSSFSPHGFECT